MEIKISSKQVLLVLNILSWILFIGLAFEAGSIICSAIFTSFNPARAEYFGLSDVYRFDAGYFFVTLLVMAIPAIMKAMLFYLIVKISSNKELSIEQPFNEQVKNFIVKAAYLALGIGFFTIGGANHHQWLISKGVIMPNLEQLHLDGGDVWIFMCVLLFIIVQVFKKGIALHAENELTI